MIIDNKHNKRTVVLVNLPPSIDYSYATPGGIFPSIPILLIGSVLKKHGFDVKIIEGNYYENYGELLTQYIIENTANILFIGMSVMTPQVPFALNISQKIKRAQKEIPIVWGGPHPTLFPEQTLRNDNVDIISINEGTFTALKIAESLHHAEIRLSSINGIAYKNGNDIVFTPGALLEDISGLPYFDFSLIEINNYLNYESFFYRKEFTGYNGRIKVLPILTGLGCPYKCQFCINVILKRRYRFREADSIISEIKHLINEYGANTFIFMDEDFFINKRRAKEFLSLVEKENMHFNWRMWCRVDHINDNFVNRDVLQRLSRIGHGSLVMGAESANQDILDNLKKGITPDQILRSLHMTTGNDMNIIPRYSFMVGLEDETMTQIKRTYNFCLKMKDIRSDVNIAGPYAFRLYPGSPIYDRLVERYEIKMPQNLEKWKEFLESSKYNTYTNTNMPWAPRYFQKHFQMINFYAGTALRTFFNASGIKGLMRVILAKVSQFRLRHFIFILPLEYWFFKYWPRLRLKNIVRKIGMLLMSAFSARHGKA